MPYTERGINAVLLDVLSVNWCGRKVSSEKCESK